MATGPRECKTYVLSASYRQDNHAPAVLPAVVLGGDEDDALGAATTASCAACIYNIPRLEPRVEQPTTRATAT